VPAIWLLDPSIRRERELARFRLHLVRHRTTLKNRIHATLVTFGEPARCPTCSAWPAATCSTAWRSPTRGGATSTRASS
jgi:transposase